MTPGFGEYIRQSLSEQLGLEAKLVRSRGALLEMVLQKPFRLVLLDVDLGATVEMVQVIRQAVPDCYLILIQDPAASLQLPKNLPVHGWLSKPFYLPDLIGILKQLAGVPSKSATVEGMATVAEEQEEPIQTSPHTAPEEIEKDQPAESPETADGAVTESAADAQAETSLPWLQDVHRAAQHLTRLSLETSAQAALIVRQAALWAYAGQLSQAEALELALTVVEDWAGQLPDPRSGRNDLARFVRLETTGGEYMLYATPLVEDMVLALAFEAAMPFSQMRVQAGNLARALAAPPDKGGVNIQPAAAAASSPDPADAVHPSQGMEEPAAPVEPEDEDELDDWSEDDLDVPARPLFAPEFVPPPTPSDTDPVPVSLDMDEWLVEEDSLFDLQQPAVVKNWKDERPSDEAIEEQAEEADEVDLTWSLGAQPVLDRPPGRYKLYYACVLTPRLPQHHLSGDLKEALFAWMQELSLAFEWPLEHITIRPDYLLWVTSPGPETSPAVLVNTIRRHTSQRIFAAFPELQSQNPSRDFWASGYLLLTTAQPPPAKMLREFIQSTHQRQRAQRDDD